MTARDGIPAKKFGYWLNISPLLYSNNPQTPATVGAPDPHDIVAHYNDIVVAFAFYNELKQPLFIPPRDAFYDPWWWIKTLGGLVPPPPRDPWAREFGVAMALADMADRVSPRLRIKLLEVALEQTSIVSAMLKEQMRALEKK